MREFEAPPPERGTELPSRPYLKVGALKDAAKALGQITSSFATLGTTAQGLSAAMAKTFKAAAQYEDQQRRIAAIAKDCQEEGLRVIKEEDWTKVLASLKLQGLVDMAAGPDEVFLLIQKDEVVVRVLGNGATSFTELTREPKLKTGEPLTTHHVRAARQITERDLNDLDALLLEEDDG